MLKDELVVNPSKYDVLNAIQDYLCKFSTQNFPSRFLLIKRLSLFFKDKLEFALNLPTYFNSKDKANNFGLFDSLKSFIFYILPYRDLFQKKCSFCGKTAKFNRTDNNFYPPYYKETYMLTKYLGEDNKTNLINLDKLYHEECFNQKYLVQI